VQHRSPPAFVDVETTGLSPAANRIAEIGVVTVDGARVDRWSSRLRVPRRRVLDACVDSPPDDAEDAPAFADTGIVDAGHVA
jgi:DNA polymerase-3 subunit epsilon